jgi:hypothetical protein
MAKRHGLRLEKSRARDPEALTWGTYWLVNPHSNTVFAGDTSNGYGMALDEIETALLETFEERAASATRRAKGNATDAWLEAGRRRLPWPRVTDTTAGETAGTARAARQRTDEPEQGTKHHTGSVGPPP